MINPTTLHISMHRCKTSWKMTQKNITSRSSIRFSSFPPFPQCPFLTPPFSCTDPPDQLRLYGPRAEWQHSLRLLLPRGTAGLLPGPGHDGHRHGDGVELRVHAGLGGQLRREWRGGLHTDLKRNWYEMPFLSFLSSRCNMWLRLSRWERHEVFQTVGRYGCWMVYSSSVDQWFSKYGPGTFRGPRWGHWEVLSKYKGILHVPTECMMLTIYVPA